MKKSLLVLALLFSLVSFAQSPADKSFPPEELFALGSYYYPEPVYAKCGSLRKNYPISCKEKNRNIKRKRPLSTPRSTI